MENKVTCYNQDHLKVSVIRRLFAYLIDAYIISILCYAPILYIQSISRVESKMEIDIFLQNCSINQLALFTCLGMIASILYFVIIPRKNGQTLGKKILGIKIVPLNGKKLNYFQLFKRAIVGMILIEGMLFMSSSLLQELILREFDIKVDIFNIYFITTLLSIGYSFFDKKNRMIHDLIAQTKIEKVL